MPPVLLLVGVWGCLTALPRRWRSWTPRQVDGYWWPPRRSCSPLALAVVGSLLSDGLRSPLRLPRGVLLSRSASARSSADLSLDHQLLQRALPVGVRALIVPVAGWSSSFPSTTPMPLPTRAPSVRTTTGGSPTVRCSRVPRGDSGQAIPSCVDGETMRYLPPSGGPLGENASDRRTHPSSTLTPFDLAASDEDRSSVQDTFIALFNRGQRLGSNCRERLAERRRYFQRAVMSQVARASYTRALSRAGSGPGAGRVGSPDLPGG